MKPQKRAAMKVERQAVKLSHKAKVATETQPSWPQNKKKNRFPHLNKRCL